ncbi:hypothetical protein [Pseudogemmobacter bohemicus]|uniref:hypothetical protein n=1 Tax=Pseudogemmobacter bohemicus TaxID=2250708 RepID=UPI000DD3A049|nr:hypothetical protein [Pseudogemmobacter bohemicus]
MTVTTPLDLARSCWGDTIPDYVVVLAEECGRSSQSAVAKRLNRSATLVSNVLRNKYSGDMAAVEDVVRGVFMGRSVTCPALGRITTAACRDWRAKGKTFSNENSERVRMFKACRNCPLARKEAA